MNIKLKVMKAFVTLILIICCFTAFCQQRINGIPIKPNEIVRQELLNKIQDFSVAWGKSDTIGLGKLLASEYRHSDVWGKILHRQDWLVYAAMPRKVDQINTADVEIL